MRRGKRRPCRGQPPAIANLIPVDADGDEGADLEQLAADRPQRSSAYAQSRTVS